MKDQLDNMLLNGSLLEDFKVRAGLGGWAGCSVTKGREALLQACVALKSRSGKILTQQISSGSRGGLQRAQSRGGGGWVRQVPGDKAVLSS